MFGVGVVTGSLKDRGGRQRERDLKIPLLPFSRRRLLRVLWTARR